MIARLLLSAFGLVFLGAVAGGAVFSQLLEPLDAGGPEVMFVVERGASLRRVATELEQQGIVRDATATRWWARVRGQASELRAGEYRLSPSFSVSEILDRLTAGRVATYEVVIPEGLNAGEIGQRLAERGLVDEAAFAAAVADDALARALGVPAPSLEGYLYPETYRLPRGLAAREVARVLVNQFQASWREVEARAKQRGLDMHEVVTLASIVEKETGAASERPLIASVFANRLRRNMRLESDPTVIFGIPDFDGNLRRRDLEYSGNPYNTYRHKGLPPGPIASPGLDSLVAVVEPADTDYLFFVSRNDGTHIFTTNYREHNDAVNRYQRRRRSSR